MSPIIRSMIHIVFRAKFIPADHPGLHGKELIPLDLQPKEIKMTPKPEVLE